MSHALVQGEALALLRELAPASVDAVITDPPYSSGGFTRGDRIADPAAKYVQSGTDLIRDSFSGDNRDARSWCYWCALWISECARILKPGGYFLMFSDWRQLPLATDAMQAGGIVWRGLIPWDKGEGARAPHCGYFRHQAEYVPWGTRGAAIVAGGGPWPGVYHEPVLQSDKHHMTGKPTRLMRQLVLCCPPGGTILDPFAGSGTTGVACALEGRDFLGFELHARNVAIGRRRIAEATAQLGLFSGWGVAGVCAVSDDMPSVPLEL